MNVETTAYVVLMMLHDGVEDENMVIEIVNWLVEQMSSEGGFYSTQDTVIGQ